MRRAVPAQVCGTIVLQRKRYNSPLLSSVKYAYMRNIFGCTSLVCTSTSRCNCGLTPSSSIACLSTTLRTKMRFFCCLTRTRNTVPVHQYESMRSMSTKRCCATCEQTLRMHNTCKKRIGGSHTKFSPPDRALSNLKIIYSKAAGWCR